MRIAITMGDPAGVGPEILLSACKSGEVHGDFFVVGDFEVLEECDRRLGSGLRLVRVRDPEECRDGVVNVLDLCLVRAKDLAIGRISKSSGAASLAYVEAATRLALDGRASALVTLPVNKEAVRLSDPGFTGHTEFIAAMCGQSDYTMMLTSDRLRVTHVSTHVPLEEAIRLVRRERVLAVIRLTHDALRRFIAQPRIAVAGLNPHAGEHGAFGSQETAEILPAVEDARRLGMKVDGPEAPDTVFFRAARGAYDAVVCMYHDQGHIPMKLLDFEGGVNVTLGLSVVRTSVDHGTAFDIAWQGKASTRSFVEAWTMASKLVGHLEEGVRGEKPF